MAFAGVPLGGFSRHSVECGRIEMDLPNNWIAEAKLCFADGCPNGVLRKWQLDRFFVDLKAACPNQKIRNATDFNYAYCNKYLIVPLQPPDVKRAFEATIAFSFICNAFSFHWTSYSRDKRRGRVVAEHQLPKSLMGLQDKLTEFACERGFVQIENDWMDIEIDGVELELADVATLGKCLFNDF